ncbi:MAG TPA: metalloregulator ArsR/SmtB family transcription factor [Candidatus Dormibacteraeota bacterium]|nr:metalloregulator ArsR/SmtB family transcription factor [Candidatus Dormibacteraeota bacterium]
MPTLAEERSQVVLVRPSAPLELMWVMHFVESNHSCEGSHASLEPLRERYGPELTELRGDALSQYSSELVVLAHRAGAMRDLDLRRFFDRFEAVVAEQADIPSLRSETPAERRIVRERLQRLRSDRGLRKRYLELLTTLWRAVEPEWLAVGRAGAVAEASRWTAMVSEGVGFHEVLGLRQLWPGRPDLDAMAEEGAAAGRLTLNPCWFGGKVHIVELDGEVLAGRSVRQGEPPYRKVAAEVASSMKALADPTRLTILLRLARQRASVTEIARHLKLSQPTVSAHVQVLREAGLLEERAVGRSAELSASEEGLRRLFSTAEDSMIKLFR